jgi:hypothetical protein
MRQGTQSAKFMQAMIVFLSTGGVIFWVAIEMRKPAGSGDLKVEVADLRSNVSEAMKIIEVAAAGRLTARFFQTETSMLQEKLAKTAKTLGSAKPEPGFESKFAQARELAESAKTELGGLSSSFGDKSAMAEARAKLEEIFREASSLLGAVPLLVITHGGKT